MPGSTPTYGLPYQTNTDPPNGPTLGQNLAEAVEGQIARLDNPAVAQVRQTTAQTIANNTWTSLIFQVDDIDTHNGHLTGVSDNQRRYTAQVAGMYLLSGCVAWAASSAGQRWSRWARNGTEINGSLASAEANGSGQQMAVARTMVVSLGVGDYIELQAWQSSGGNLDTYVGVTAAQSSMTVVRLRP